MRRRAAPRAHAHWRFRPREHLRARASLGRITRGLVSLSAVKARARHAYNATACWFIVQYALGSTSAARRSSSLLPRAGVPALASDANESGDRERVPRGRPRHTAAARGPRPRSHTRGRRFESDSTRRSGRREAHDRPGAQPVEHGAVGAGLHAAEALVDFCLIARARPGIHGPRRAGGPRRRRRTALYVEPPIGSSASARRGASELRERGCRRRAVDEPLELALKSGTSPCLLSHAGLAWPLHRRRDHRREEPCRRADADLSSAIANLTSSWNLLKRPPSITTPRSADPGVGGPVASPRGRRSPGSRAPSRPARARRSRSRRSALLAARLSAPARLAIRLLALQAAAAAARPPPLRRHTHPRPWRAAPTPSAGYLFAAPDSPPRRPPPCGSAAAAPSGPPRAAPDRDAPAAPAGHARERDELAPRSAGARDDLLEHCSASAIARSDRRRTGHPPARPDQFGDGDDESPASAAARARAPRSSPPPSNCYCTQEKLPNA